jgi:futalosine hydrolase
VRLRERLRRLPRLLIVTAVEPERQAVLRGLGLNGDAADELAGRSPIVVAAGGVGPAAAAATTSRMLTVAELTEFPFTLIVSAGVAGGFAPRAAIGATVLGGRSVAGDLGADSADGFISLDDLGFGSSIVDSDAVGLEMLGKALPQAVVGDIITVSTVTGTADATSAMLARYPAAVAEAMEGFGVATAAGQADVAFLELRTISNLVGPRDRDGWKLAEALAALATAAGSLPDALRPTEHTW